MPNWVTDNNSNSVNTTSSSSAVHVLHAPPVTNNDLTELSQTDSEVANPAQTNQTLAEDNMSAQTQLPQVQATPGQDSAFAILLSPDTPPASTVPNPLPVQTQPSSTNINMQSILPQQPANHLSHFGSNTPQEQSPALPQTDLPANTAQPSLRRAVSSGTAQNGVQAYPTNLHRNVSSPNQSFANPTTGVSSTTLPLPKSTTATHNIYSVSIKDNQTANIKLTPEYATRKHIVPLGDGTAHEISTLEIISRYASYLSIQDLDKIIREPKALIALAGNVYNAVNANASNPKNQHAQQQQQQMRNTVNPPSHHIPQSANQQAGPSRPTPFVATSGYTYIPQDNPAQIQQSIANLQNQARPSSRQSGLPRNASGGGGNATPLQSPRIPNFPTDMAPEVQVLQQEFNAGIQGVEQLFGQAWEQLRTVSNNAFLKMGATVNNIKSHGDSDTIINQLRAQVIEEQNKLHLSQQSVLRLTESESKARSDLIEKNHQLQNEIDVRNKAQELNNQLAQRVEEMKRGKATDSAKIIQLTNQVNVQSGNIRSIEAEHQRKLAHLNTSHNITMNNLKKELAEALDKAKQPIFGAAHPTSQLSPKSPADPASEAAKLRSLLKANNAKFTELEEKYNKEMTLFKARSGLDPREIEKDIRSKLAQSTDVKVQKLEKRVKELEDEKEKVSASEKNVRDQHEQTTVVLGKIIHWGENLQSKLGRSTEDTLSDHSSTSINAEPSKRALVDRANSFVTDMSKLAETIINNEKERKEKMKRLQGQVESMRVDLAAAAKSAPSSSEGETEEWKIAFNKLISWGNTIQVLMGKHVDPFEEGMKPQAKADLFQKRMHVVFEDLRSKTLPQGTGQADNEEKMKKLEETITVLRNNLQANLNALLAKTTQLDDTTKTLEETRGKLSASEKSVREGEEKYNAVLEKLVESQNALAAKTKQCEEIQKNYEDSGRKMSDVGRAYAKLGVDLQEAKQLKEEAEAKLGEVEKELKAKEEHFTKTVTTYQSTIDELRAEDAIDGKTDESAKLAAQVEKANRKIEELTQTIEGLEKEVEGLKGDLENEQDNVDRAETDMRVAMENQYKQREEYLEPDKVLKSVKEERDNAREEVKKLQGELNTFKSKNSTTAKDDDDIQIVSGPGPSSTSTIPKKRPGSSLFTPNPKNSHSPSPAPLVKPAAQSSQATPSVPPTRVAGTPLFLPNEEEDESQSQTQSTPSVSASVQRPVKKRKMVVDSEDEGTPGLEVTISTSRAPSVASDRPAPSFKPVSREWVRKNIGITTQRSGGRVRCKLCFVDQKKALPADRLKTFKVEDIAPLELGIDNERVLDHVLTHKYTLRRLKDKRVRDGKDRASPEP
ncbi:hypothetical protein I302_109052 [Kwoniella bestiolae CBS 10118]|uniref:Uncharacterized protein n=1 Tax=Kwoniella bestiolae CBS 10118 TaxID=1296100 RepID=A0A1B9FUU8_9TREE|nr:hypothetical protein I302_08196 [Kwoniella bestiolae CBS 10118]OCF22546.1 hypothetical protein I302_08196 [Kwoniella bestiolae CBS 10118]